MITGKNYIGFNLEDSGTVKFNTFNPITNTPNNQEFTQASPEEIDRAVALATQAFSEYRNYSGARKAAFLNAIANQIMALGDHLISTYVSETGLPEGRAKGERGRTVYQLQTFANLLEEGNWVNATIDTALPDRTPAPKPDLRRMNIPLGPVVVFGASNFPLAYSTAGGDTAAALAAGCPVIVKSHPMHAGTGELVSGAIVKAARETGMPNGVFSNLNSSGIEVGTHVVKHSGVKAVGFTGSIRGGRALFNLAAERPEPIPVFAEMGSINPVIVLPEALSQSGKQIATTYASSINLGVGQFCTNPGLILGVQSPELDTFCTILSEQLAAQESGCMLHPNIHSAYNQNRDNALAQENTAALLSPQGSASPNYAQQALARASGANFLANSQLHQEVFGPFSMVVACANMEELITVVKQLEGQLTGTVMANNNEAANYPELISAMQNRVGRIIYNGVPTGVEVCPSMVHGGPYPASTDSRFSAVGIHSIDRWVRPFSYQDWPDDLLPDALKNNNPLRLKRLVNNVWTTDSI